LRVLYDVFGRNPGRERELPDFAGFGGARPVRVGNGARDQLQLDVYGEVIDAVVRFTHEGGSLDQETAAMLHDFGEYVCHYWELPDEGIWEPRMAPRHHTHSRVLCWTALDRLLELHERGHLHASVDRFGINREMIRREVETRGWNASLGSYVQVLDGSALDASLLLLPWYGFEDAGSARMRRTYARVVEHLGAGDGLLYRYRDGISPGEGAFGICSFWAVEHLARGGGTWLQAHQLFERLLGYANDVGLFAEEILPESGAPLGNFPQAFTHVGLINAAISLNECEAREAALHRAGRRPVPAECSLVSP
jgi:GH15 family glucan-1,4-alpha-glucosidase